MSGQRQEYPRPLQHYASADFSAVLRHSVAVRHPVRPAADRLHHSCRSFRPLLQPEASKRTGITRATSRMPQALKRAGRHRPEMDPIENAPCVRSARGFVILPLSFALSCRYAYTGCDIGCRLSNEQSLGSCQIQMFDIRERGRLNRQHDTGHCAFLLAA